VHYVNEGQPRPFAPAPDVFRLDVLDGIPVEKELAEDVRFLFD